VSASYRYPGQSPALSSLDTLGLGINPLLADLLTSPNLLKDYLNNLKTDAVKERQAKAALDRLVQLKKHHQLFEKPDDLVCDPPVNSRPAKKLKTKDATSSTTSSTHTNHFTNSSTTSEVLNSTTDAAAAAAAVISSNIRNVTSGPNMSNDDLARVLMMITKQNQTQSGGAVKFESNS